MGSRHRDFARVNSEHRGVCLVGGGGHAKVCLDVLTGAGIPVRGVVDIEPPPAGLGLPYLGDDDWLTARLLENREPVLVAIGSNARRATVQADLEAKGAILVTAVSAWAIVSPSAVLGVGTVVMPGAVINAYARIGRGVIVNTAATVDHDCDIGDWAHIAPGVHLAGEVRVGSGAFLGVGTNVIPKCSIGEWSTLGAGTTVIRDVPDRSLQVGVPNRGIREHPRP